MQLTKAGRADFDDLYQAAQAFDARTSVFDVSLDTRIDEVRLAQRFVDPFVRFEGAEDDLAPVLVVLLPENVGLDPRDVPQAREGVELAALGHHDQGPVLPGQHLAARGLEG